MPMHIPSSINTDASSIRTVRFSYCAPLLDFTDPLPAVALKDGSDCDTTFPRHTK